MDTKIWFLLTIVTLVQSRDLSEGSQNGGSKIFSENKKASPAIWRQMENITISGEEDAKINRILVTDLREEKDGEARIVEGGIGQRNVTIELKSPTALRGYDFHIEVYANSDNEQTQSTGHDDRLKQETSPARSLVEETTMKASPSVPISLSRQETTLEQVHEESMNGKSGGKRQNRDAEDKDNQFSRSHSFTNLTAEVSELKSTGNPTLNKDKREDHNKVPEQGITNQPSIHLHETNKMPESTARTILSKEFKITEENHQHVENHDNFEEKNKQTTFNMNEKRTNINYPKFNVREVTHDVPVVNAPLPIVEDGHKRHSRDVNKHNTPVVEITEHSLPSSGTFKNQGDIQSTEIKVPSDQAQRDNQDNGHAIPSDISLKHFENNQNKEQIRTGKVEEKETLGEHQNNNNAFKGRYIPDRFARNPAYSGSANDETSTEINKISTPPPTIARSKSVNLNLNSAQSNTPQIPKIISSGPTTNKPETITSKQVNHEINSSQHISSNMRSTSSEENTAHKRVTRDTAENNREPSVLSHNFKNLSVLPTTLKPEINGKSALDINGSKINNSDNLKTPIKISSDKENTNTNGAPKAVHVESEDKQRNARGTDENKEDNKLNTLSSLTKHEHKESHEEKASTAEAQKHVEVPIERKSTSPANTNIKPETTNAAKEKERNSRDVNNVQKSENNDTEKVSSSTEVSADVEIEKGAQKLSEKSAIKGKEDQKETPTVDTTNVKSTTKSEINPKNSENPTQGSINAGIKNSQPGKFSREIKLTDLEETTKPSVDRQNDSNLSTANKASSTITSNEDKIEKTKQPEKSLTPPH